MRDRLAVQWWSLPLGGLLAFALGIFTALLLLDCPNAHGGEELSKCSFVLHGTVQMATEAKFSQSSSPSHDIVARRADLLPIVTFSNVPRVTVRAVLQPLEPKLVAKLWLDYNFSVGTLATGRTLRPANFVNPAAEKLIITHSFPYTDPGAPNVTGLRFIRGTQAYFVVAGVHQIPGLEQQQTKRFSGFIQYFLPAGIKLGLLGESTVRDAKETRERNWGADLNFKSGAVACQSTYMFWQNQTVSRAWMVQSSVRLGQNEMALRAEGRVNGLNAHRYTAALNHYTGLHRVSLNTVAETIGRETGWTVLLQQQITF